MHYSFQLLPMLPPLVFLSCLHFILVLRNIQIIDKGALNSLAISLFDFSFFSLTDDLYLPFEKL